MAEVLLMLRLEHRNTESLLELLESQQTMMAAGQPPDGALLGLAMRYFLDFPDRCHHPKEDLVYAALQRRCPDRIGEFEDLSADHRQLAARTRELADRVFEGTLAGAEGAQALGAFIEGYRRHLDAEERRVFPLAEEHLTAEDWAAIDGAVFEGDDPLFDHATEQRFAELRSELRAGAHDALQRAAMARDARSLDELRDVSGFNALMARQGRSLRLVEFQEGGFGIERDGQLLARLPSCSRARAAWAAFLFERGGALAAAGGAAPR